MTQSASRLATAFKNACLAELEALKPGNVHIFADGHGMVVNDFINSAEAAAAVIAMPDLCVGERIALAVEASWQAVGCNTNLGILLLCAPLLHAAQQGAQDVRTALPVVLQGLTQEDAVHAYRAIRRAAPAGLATSTKHDVQAEPEITLLQAMREAEQRDRIAWQYTHDFVDVFEALAQYQTLLARWERPAWAASAVYLQLLAKFPDSHIQRKFGAVTAEGVRQQATSHAKALLALDNPKTYMPQLLAFDKALKESGLNPGTSADLTVACLLLQELQAIH